MRATSMARNEQVGNHGQGEDIGRHGDPADDATQPPSPIDVRAAEREMHTWLSSHRERTTEHAEREIRYETLAILQRYLPLVPLGQYHQINRSGEEQAAYRSRRMQLYEERGHRCDACSADVPNDQFELHHTNYYRG